MNVASAPRRGGLRTALITPRRRNTLRLPTWDYTEHAYYYVTLVTHGRDMLFQGAALKEIADATWRWLAKNFDHVELDEYVVMPNHLHGIIALQRNAVPGRSRMAPTRKPLGGVIGAFKTVSTRTVNERRRTPGRKLWQRNFYDRIIRSDRELAAARRYIRDNPAKWALDPMNPDRQKRQRPV